VHKTCVQLPKKAKINPSLVRFRYPKIPKVCVNPGQDHAQITVLKMGIVQVDYVLVKLDLLDTDVKFLVQVWL